MAPIDSTPRSAALRAATALGPAVTPNDVAMAMYAGDEATRLLGISVDEVGLGWAVLSMVVRDDMVNGHGVCHGGLIFTLADSAFAYACNSSNHVTLAASATIDFIAPAVAGDRLIARTTELWTGGRSGLTDVEVTTVDGRRVAIFRGRSARTGGPVVS